MKLKPTLRKATELGISLSAVATLILAGCGGGGSSGSNAGVAATKVSGVAAKGIIKNADVTAYELKADGSIAGTVGTSVTDNTGKYSLTIDSSYTGGPIKLVLTPKSDGTTLMVCDVATAGGCGTDPVTGETITFGKDIHLSPAFALAAYQPSVSKTNATVTSQITPYTNMVAANVQAALLVPGTTLNNDLVLTATSKLSTLVGGGVNIATTEPVDITNASAVAAASATSLQYGAFNAAIGDVAFASGNFASGVQAVAEAFADGTLGNGSDAVTITDITTAVTSEVTAATTLSGTDTSAITNQLTVIAGSTTGGTYTPTPTATATMTPLAQAKALVSQTRTWVTQIAALQTPATAFGVNVNTASTVLNSNSAVLGAVFSEMLGRSFNVLAIQAHSASGLQTGTYPIAGSIWNGGALVPVTGTVTVATSNGYLTWTIDQATNAGVTTSGTVTSTIPSSVLGQPSTNLNLGTSTTMTVNGTASMTSPAAASITVKNAVLSLGLKAAGSTSTMTASNIASLGFNGSINMQAGSVSFDGTGEFDLLANNVTNAVKPFSLSKIALSGTFTDNSTSPASSANASASVTFNNAATFDTIGLLTYQPVVWVGNWQPGDAFNVAKQYASYIQTTYGVADTLQGGYYDGNQTCGWGVTTSGCLPGDPFGIGVAVTSDINAAYTNPAPSSIQNVSAGYDAYSGGSWYNAMLTFPDFESASKFANVTITISSKVSLAGNPDATLTVTANRTAYGSSAKPFAGNVDAILSFSGQTIDFQASNTGTNAGTLTITNPDGVAIVLNGTLGNNTTGTVTAGGTQVGTIDTSNGIKTITYSDSTFESLN